MLTDRSISSIGRTNRNYSEEEEIHIRSAQLAAESLLLSGNVDGDPQRREEIVDFICRCKVALAPYKKLPHDVFRTIFHFCCNETHVDFPLSTSYDVDLCLLRITHVCSAWRQLALETPALWSDIGIYLSSRNRERHQKTLFSARQWFDRAQDMPRSLIIGLRWSDTYSSSQSLRDLWGQVLEFIALYPIKELELEYPINDFTLILKLPNHTWPSIECLKLIGNDNLDSGLDKLLFSHFRTLSNLRHFHIRDAYDLRGLEHAVPWHQLQTLEIRTSRHSGIKPSLCLNMLRQCRLLEDCSLSLAKEPSFTSAVTYTKEERIILSNMKYFSLEFCDGSAASAFLQPLVIPSITTLVLELPILERKRTRLNCDMPALIGIIQRSAGMHQISLLEIEISSHVLDVGVLLGLLPSLERISIKSGHLDDNAIKGLSTGKLGPRLYEICLDHMHDADKILSMVESRYRNATRSSDGENSLCPFECVWISCTAAGKPQFYRNRITFLSELCNALIWLGVGFGKGQDSQDENSEDDS
ncbi:hypothetical protein F5887DRAFT_1184643 [Amanita rubescens]|nr:hypothetical protein F5887DRAFT_1184643 [Amanita rubescens]